jgi:hypothetical protein
MSSASKTRSRRVIEDRWTVLSHHPPGSKSLKGCTPESWFCVDCGVNTAPGLMTRKEVEVAFLLYGEANQHITSESEVYTVTPEVWQATGLDDHGGCLCIGCLEQRIGRRLKPKDFLPDHVFNELRIRRPSFERCDLAGKGRSHQPPPTFAVPAGRRRRSFLAVHSIPRGEASV